MFKFIELITVTLVTGCISSQAFRLPTIYNPINYEIHLTVQDESFSETVHEFTGTVAITFNVTENTNQIELHSSHQFVTIVEATIDDRNIETGNYTVNSTTDILTINLGGRLGVDYQHVLKISYNGTLVTTQMNGFYKRSYNDSDGVTNYFLTTQFETIHARKAFPCFDEPAYKASFDISLTYPTQYQVLSNTAASGRNENLTTGLTTTTFQRTPVMSTYLVAFTISNFTCTQGALLEGKAGSTSQVCSRPETESTRNLAVDLAPKLIDVFNSYTGINYTSHVSKLDQLAVPDFAAGAMENWGHVTSRETALLYDDNNTANIDKEFITRVIAHELSHQWFGNLVTCKWWSESFLNEGFATLFEYFGSHEILPEYQLDKQYVIKIVQFIFDQDSFTTAHALRHDASTPAEISARFGLISYYKGGSVLRMIQHVLGADNFKLALRNYLNDNAFSGAEPENLLEALSGVIDNTVSNLPDSNLSTVFGSWIDKPGYPVLTVSLNNDSSISITQERFLFSGNDSDSRWYVPITLTTSNDTAQFENTAPQYWLTPADNLTIRLYETFNWVVVNNQQTGFYRVNYDSDLWSSLADALAQSNFSGIHEINRAQIVDDAFNLARARYVSYSQVFSVLEFLKSETSYITWFPTFNGFNYLFRRVGLNTTLGNAIANHLLDLSATLRESVPLQKTNDSDHIYSLKQQLANNWFCKLGNATCVQNVRELFELYKTTLVPPNKNLRSVVYCNALINSNSVSEDWAFLWQAYENATLATEKATILSALGCATNESILASYLEKTITDNSGIRSQDYVSVFQSVYTGTTAGVDIALDFLVENFDSIRSRYTNIRNVIRGLAEFFTAQAQIDKLQTFALNLNDSATIANFNSAITLAKSNLEWTRLSESQLNSFFGLVEDETTTTSNVSTIASPSSSTIIPVTPDPNSSFKISCSSVLVLVIVAMMNCLYFEL